MIFDALDDWYSEAQPISGEELPFLYPRWNQIWLLFFFKIVQVPPIITLLRSEFILISKDHTVDFLAPQKSLFVLYC